MKTKKQTMKKLLISTVFLLIFKFNYSQSYNNQSKEFFISGVISSLENDELLEYATITLLDTTSNNVITGGVSNDSGKFSFPAKEGNYDILIEYISFKNVTLNNVVLNDNLDLGEIKLELDFESLAAVSYTHLTLPTIE